LSYKILLTKITHLNNRYSTGALRIIKWEGKSNVLKKLYGYISKSNWCKLSHRIYRFQYIMCAKILNSCSTNGYEFYYMSVWRSCIVTKPNT
jgi:hypothetical protein